MNKKINVYCDMDGVIADFNNEPNALERFKTEKGFFARLKPMNADGFKELLARKEINLYILSASPNKQADKDKIEWLKKWYPQIKRSHIIIMRNGKNKADFMKTKKGVLLDDYGKNCEQWRERGNKAIQIKKTLSEHLNEFLIMPVLDY
jgi:5'(3')-deoxyribonucleotidase